MKILSIVVMGLLLFAMCCSTDKGPIHGRLIDRLMSKFVFYVEKKYQVRCYGSGGAWMDKIREVDFSFDIPGPKTKSEVRTLMVNIADDFLNQINSDLEIRDHLINYPFTVNNLRFSITLVEPKVKCKAISNKGNSKELLAYLRLGRGKISYAILNDDKVYYQEIFEEPYEEAYQIVKSQHLLNTQH